MQMCLVLCGYLSGFANLQNTIIGFFMFLSVFSYYRIELPAPNGQIFKIS